MPLKSDTVESASRTLLLLEELNRHRVTSIDRLHKATGLPKSTVVRLMKSLCAMGYAANDRRQGGYAVASRVKSLSNGFHGDPLVVEAARPWALAFTGNITGRSRSPCSTRILSWSASAPFPTARSRHFTAPSTCTSACSGGRWGVPTWPSAPWRTLDAARHAGTVAGGRRQTCHRAKRALALLATIRKQGFAERDPMVEPRSSGTIAVPIIVNQRVLATVGMTYFTSALDRADVVQRYVPLVKALADNIAASVSSLQQ